MFGGPETALWLLLIVASATDLLWGKIFNWLTFPFLFTGILLRFVSSSHEGQQALLSVAVAFLLFFPLYLVKAVAAGDAKLLMAVGAWTSPGVLLQIAGISILIGAGVGFFSLLKKRGVRGGARSIAENIQQGEPTATAMKMPFGPAFFCAYLVVTIAQYRHWELL